MLRAVRGWPRLDLPQGAAGRGQFTREHEVFGLGRGVGGTAGGAASGLRAEVCARVGVRGRTARAPDEQDRADAVLDERPPHLLARGQHRESIFVLGGRGRDDTDGTQPAARVA